MKQPENTDILGVKVTLTTREELKEHLIQTTYNKGRFRLIILDEKKLFSCVFQKKHRQVVNQADIVISSSQTVSWMVKRLTGHTVPVIMPVTLFLDFMRTADEMNYTVFLYGGNQRIAQETLKRVRKSFPQARIVGNYRSNIRDRELEDVLTTIRKSSPQILFAGIGGGLRQEKWIKENMHYFQNSIVAGVDTAFTVISGQKKMPPMWVQKKGWNGFYMTLTQPYNLVRLFRVFFLFALTLAIKLCRALKKIRKPARGVKK